MIPLAAVVVVLVPLVVALGLSLNRLAEVSDERDTARRQLAEARITGPSQQPLTRIGHDGNDHSREEEQS